MTFARLFRATGAALATAPELRFTDERSTLRANVVRGAEGCHGYAIRHEQASQRASLAFCAPLDQFYTATDVTEWALGAHCARRHALELYHAPGHAAWDRELAMRACWPRSPPRRGRTCSRQQRGCAACRC